MSKVGFDQLYASLNTAQKEAVDTIDGPVMVVAGPGTGKTQILAARIANILRQTDTSAYQILCLTYTDAGVVAMRERLVQFIGPLAYRVHIHTFHSLCNEIIQFNGAYFGFRNLQPATELDVYEIIREIIDELPVDSVLKRLKGEVYYDATDLRSLFDLVKKENFDIGEIRQKADRYLQEKEDNGDFTYKVNGKNFKKGDRKEKDYNEEKLKVERLKAAADLYPVFNSKMSDRRLYDFSDMILWVLKAFKEDKNFLLNYQERYLYFLVDEFQDTNGSQLQLVNYLTEYWEVPNLFVVGDEDQSIYRFQGANVGNILEFADTYKSFLKTTVLRENYRSSQKILDASMALIQVNTDRIKEIDKQLQAMNPDYASELQGPVIQEYFNPVHEAVGIGNAIMRLHSEGAAYSEMAVLYRNHRHVEDLVKFFNANNIPFNSRKKVNVLEELLVRKLLTILAYINAEITKPYSGEPYIFEILNYDFYKIKPIELAKLSADIRSKRNMRWRDMLTEITSGPQDLFSNMAGMDSRTELRRLVSDLEYWISQANNLTVPQLVEKLIAKGGILSYVMQADGKRWQMQILRTFFDFVKEEAARKPEMKLKDLLDTIETYREFDIPVEALQVLHVPDSVNLMTLHGSKGLEFDHVFIIKAVDSEWIKKRGSSSDFGLSKIYASFRENSESDIEEIRRLMYVGMTRARCGLNMSYYKYDLKEKEVNKLQFIAELEELAGLQVQQAKPAEEDVLLFEGQYYQYEETPEFELIDHAYLDILLADYTMSATHLNTYLRCPVSFYFNHILRVPSAKNESATFGTAMHDALEAMFRTMQMNEGNTLPELEELVKNFELSMWRNRDSFTEKGYQRYLANGRQVLPKYYARYAEQWKKEKIFTVEKNMHHVELGGIPIKGKLDRIVFDGNNAYVVDFKTGNYERARLKCRPPKEDPKPDNYEEVYGGDYWRQMIFYHLLIENDHSNRWTMNRGEMNFLEPDKHDQFYAEKFDVTPEDAAIVAGQVKDTHTRIMSHEFQKGCGKENCEWCNFVKYYLKKEIYVAEALPKTEEE